MKSFSIAIIAIAVVGLLTIGVAIVGKPGDTEIIYDMRRLTGQQDLADQVLAAAAINDASIRIEDRVLYKNIYRAIDGQYLGSAYFFIVDLK